MKTYFNGFERINEIWPIVSAPLLGCVIIEKQDHNKNSRILATRDEVKYNILLLLFLKQAVGIQKSKKQIGKYTGFVAINRRLAKIINR